MEQTQLITTLIYFGDEESNGTITIKTPMPKENPRHNLFFVIASPLVTKKCKGLGHNLSLKDFFLLLSLKLVKKWQKKIFYLLRTQKDTIAHSFISSNDRVTNGKTL